MQVANVISRVQESLHSNMSPHIFCTDPKVCQGIWSDIFLHDWPYRHRSASCTPVSSSKTNVWSRLNRTEFYNYHSHPNKRRMKNKYSHLNIKCQIYVPQFLCSSFTKIKHKSTCVSLGCQSKNRETFLTPEGKSIQKSVKSTNKLTNCRQSPATETLH